MRFRSKSIFFGLAVAVLAGMSLISCQVQTPQTRITENPVLFQSLPANQQALVRQGRICEGMSPDAVFLAWGRPNSVPYEGQNRGKRVTRWVYTTSDAVLVDQDPYWYGPCHRCWDPFYAGPSVIYVPRDAATVLFEDGKVVSWESRGR